MTLSARTGLFAVFCALVAALNWQPLQALYAHSMSDETASHIVLIPLISAGLVVMQRRAIFATVGTDWRAAAPLLLAGAALFAWALAYRPVQDTGVALTITIAPVVVLWSAGFVLFYGARAARAATFPMLFLALTVPFPPALLEAASDFLKDGSTEVVAALFTATGTPHIREGYVFRLPYVAIEVADACSGIRSGIGLFITSLLAGHMFLHTAWKKAVLALVIIPITIFKNGVRIVTLSLLSIHVNPSYLTGQLHHEGGVLFFLLALALLAPVLFFLVRFDRTGRLSHMPARGRPVALGEVS